MYRDFGQCTYGAAGIVGRLEEIAGTSNVSTNCKDFK